MITEGALSTHGLMTVHDALQDASEWRHTDAAANENGVLGVEDLARCRAVRAIDEALKTYMYSGITDIAS